MRLGLYINVGSQTLQAMVGKVRTAAKLGLDSAFFTQLTSWDSLTVAALCGQRAPGIDVGTAVVQTYPRHPIVMASQALTAQAATGNRFTLGIGPSHRQVIEGQFGYAYERPAHHIREYLGALRPLLRGEPVELAGQALPATGQVDVPGATPPPILVSALGPLMLRVAGELADGTVTVWTGPETIDGYIRPRITAAARDAGRPAPRIVATVMVSVSADPDRVKQEVAHRFAPASELSGYRALLERQGKSGVHETLVAGDEAVALKAIRQYAEAGATELLVSPAGSAEERARTLEFLGAARRE